MALRIGIVAAEPSGDLLAAGLMSAIREARDEVEFEGIAGPRMQAVGMESWFPMERLSVMGLVEVLGHLRELLGIRRELAARWRDAPPDLFIGVDAPDFNLALEQMLRDGGVPTVHYVCPTVWAWRPRRVVGIRRAVDLLLSIFPFEQEFLQTHGVPSRYVGHPLAHELPLEPDREKARTALGLGEQTPVLALLPGSRRGEVGLLSRPFLQTAEQCLQDIPGLQVITPLANEKTQLLFESERQRYAPNLPVKSMIGNSREMLTAADVVLTASGTATLEGLLCKRPMVVGYKVHWLTYLLARVFRLIKVEHVSMANLLSGEGLAPEFLQQACEPGNLVPAVLDFFQDREKVTAIQQRYLQVHQTLRMDTNKEAAQAVLSLLDR